MEPPNWTEGLAWAWGPVSALLALGLFLHFPWGLARWWPQAAGPTWEALAWIMATLTAIHGPATAQATPGGLAALSLVRRPAEPLWHGACLAALAAWILPPALRFVALAVLVLTAAAWTVWALAQPCQGLVRLLVREGEWRWPRRREDPPQAS